MWFGKVHCAAVRIKHSAGGEFAAEMGWCVELGCGTCGRGLGTYDLVDGPGLVESARERWRRRLGPHLQEPMSSYRVEHPARGENGPRTDRKRFDAVIGRDGLPAARFACGCGHTRTLGPTELRKLLARAGPGKVLI